MTRLRVPRAARQLWRDKWLLTAAFALSWRARIELSIKGFGNPLQGCSRTANLPQPSPVLAARVAWSVDRASRLVPQATCLVRAIAGQRLLAMKGFGSEIRVGVRNSREAGFEAHAWLAVDDAVILGGTSDEVGGYIPLIGAR
jgi:hypothetical protein